MPSLFANATAITIKLRCKRTSSLPDPLNITQVQLVENDELTAITSTSSVGDTTTITTLSHSMGIIGSVSKSILDGAKLKLTTSGSSGDVLVYAAQVEITYTATNDTYDESGSGGITAGTSTLIRFTYKPSTSSGTLLNGRIFFTNNIISSGGITINGSFSPVYHNFGSGGANTNGSIVINVIKNIIAIGGIENGGSCRLNTIYFLNTLNGLIGSGNVLITQNLVSSGGIINGGTSKHYRIYTLISRSFQSNRAGPSFLVKANYSVSTSGGLKTSGLTLLAMSNVISGGSLASGTSVSDIGFIASGGIIATGGDTFLTFTPQGGIKNSGTSTIKTTSNILIYNSVPGGCSTNAVRFSLTGHEVVPSVSTISMANAIIALDENNIIHWEINHTLTSAIVSIGFYGPATTGVNGPLIINLADYASITPSAIGQASVLPSQILNLINGNWYLLIKTINYPNGELRSQVILSGSKSLISVNISNINAIGGTHAAGTSTISVTGIIDGGGSKIQGTSLVRCTYAIVASTNRQVVAYGSVLNDIGGIFNYDETGLRGAKIGGEASVYISPISGVITSGTANIFIIYTDSDRFALTGANVFPPQAEINSASALISLDSKNVIRWNIDYNGAESSITNIKFKGPALADEVGPTILELGSISGLTFPNIGSYVLTTSLTNSFKDYEFYVEIYDDYYPILRNQILLNGTGNQIAGKGFSPIDLTTNGGTSIGGLARSRFRYNLSYDGGIQCGGITQFNKLSNMISTIKVRVGKFATLDLIYNLTLTGGAQIGGKAIAGITFVPSGGSIIGSEVTQFTYRNHVASGGLIASGAIKQQNFYLSVLNANGAKIGGRAKVVKIFETITVNQGIYRTLGNNLLNALELTLTTQNVKLIQITDGIIPEYEEESPNSEWCDVETQCGQGAVPDIVQKRQVLLPDNKITN
jgi:hypothetical protein